MIGDLDYEKDIDLAIAQIEKFEAAWIDSIKIPGVTMAFKDLKDEIEARWQMSSDGLAEVVWNLESELEEVKNELQGTITVEEHKDALKSAEKDVEHQLNRIEQMDAMIGGLQDEVKLLEDQNKLKDKKILNFERELCGAGTW